MSDWVEGDRGLSCPVWIELERRTNAQKVASKLQRYSGHYLRLLDEENECAIRPVLVVHFDPRTEPCTERAPGTGAEGLSVRVRERLLSEKRDNHFLKLDRRLLEIDDSLDPGRMFAVCDWWSLLALDFSTPLFAISTYPSHDTYTEEEPHDGPVGFREVIGEWGYTVRSVEEWLAREAGTSRSRVRNSKDE